MITTQFDIRDLHPQLLVSTEGSKSNPQKMLRDDCPIYVLKCISVFLFTKAQQVIIHHLLLSEEPAS